MANTGGSGQAGGYGMYSAYENQPMVIDMGSHSIRVGYSGEAHPNRVLSSVCGIASSENLINSETEFSRSQILASSLLYPLSPLGKRDHVDLIYPIQASLSDNSQGLLSYSYSSIEKMLDILMGAKWLNDPLSDHPILFTEPNITDSVYRENILEMLFETFQVPSVFLSKTAPLTAYSIAKTSGLLIDVGASGSQTCVLQEGYVLPKSFIKSPIGGDLVTQYITSLLEQSPSQQSTVLNSSDSSSAFPLNSNPSSNLSHKRVLSPIFALPNYHLNDLSVDINTLVNPDETPFEIIRTFTKETHIIPLSCPYVSPSYMQWGRQFTAEALKTKLNFNIHSDESTQNSNGNTSKIKPLLELPDGKCIESSTFEMIQTGLRDIFFSPSNFQESTNLFNPSISIYYQNSFSLPLSSLLVGTRDTQTSSSINKGIHLSKKGLQNLRAPSSNISNISPSAPLQNTLHTHPSTDISSILKRNNSITNQLYNSLQASELYKPQNNPSHTHTNIPHAHQHSQPNLSASSQYIIAAGGSTLFDGFLPCLQFEVNSHSGFNTISNNFKILASSTPRERQYASWIGGSILSCLGSFPQFCVSSEEYNELGAKTAADKKFY